MARNDPQMNLRVPVELKEKIEKAAFDNNRTITAEAISRLEKSFEQSESPDVEMHLMMEAYKQQKFQLEQMQLMMKKLLEK